MTATSNVDQALKAIRALAWKASSLVNEDFEYQITRNESPDYPNTELVAENIETAFLQLLTLAESLKLRKLSKTILKTYRRAKRAGLSKWGSFEDQSAWAYWSGPIQQFADSISAVFGQTEPNQGAVSTDLLGLLQNTQVAITDKRCFKAPANEAEVHDRIENILKCVYPDLIRKPPVAKAVVSFIPDSGIRSINTLIEYKFLSNESQIGPIANEILADTRGYAESGWANIVFVIYETRRFKTIHEWRQLLNECGLTENIGVVILCGEEPKR